jgi:hypothetical protein
VLKISKEVQRPLNVAGDPGGCDCTPGQSALVNKYNKYNAEWIKITLISNNRIKNTGHNVSHSYCSIVEFSQVNLFTERTTFHFMRSFTRKKHASSYSTT